MRTESTDVPRALNPAQAVVKRTLDLAVAGLGLVLAAPVIALAWVVATISTRANGFFRQQRIGRYGRPFDVLKIRTMRGVGGTTVTTAHDPRITPAGAWMRRFKIDELPQLVNVVRGDMSLVGPRPDVPGFADRLTGADRVLLSVRPGITSPAAVTYRHEEAMLTAAADPEAFNREVIWPAKVRINRAYLEHWSLVADLRCIRDTVRSVFTDDEGARR